MMGGEILSILLLLGCMALWMSSLASYRLQWGKMAQMALIWLAIFSTLFVLAYLTGARLPN